MISVCMATYNGAVYIKEQLESILSQLSPEDEIIISDDGSTDATLEVVAAMNEPRIRVVQGPRMKSPSKNFENALSYAKGDYIFLCDQDDVWQPNKVAVMSEALQSSACVISDCQVVDAGLNVMDSSFYHVVRKHEGRWYNLLVRNCYLGCCMAMRREVLDKALPFPDHIPMHDIWLGNVAAFYFSLQFIPNPLIAYRRHGKNASTTSDPSTSSLWQKLDYRYRIVAGLLSRIKHHYYK